MVHDYLPKSTDRTTQNLFSFVTLFPDSGSRLAARERRGEARAGRCEGAGPLARVGLEKKFGPGEKRRRKRRGEGDWDWARPKRGREKRESFAFF